MLVISVVWLLKERGQNFYCYALLKEPGENKKSGRILCISIKTFEKKNLAVLSSFADG